MKFLLYTSNIFIRFLEKLTDCSSTLVISSKPIRLIVYIRFSKPNNKSIFSIRWSFYSLTTWFIDQSIF